MVLFLLLIIDLYFLIVAVVAVIFNPTPELVIIVRIVTKEAKAEIETHSVIAEAKIRISSTYYKIVQTFLCFLLINSLWSTFLTK